LPLHDLSLQMAAPRTTTSTVDGPQLAELSGGPLSNAESIFVHLEKGLRKNPHAPAVICMHQAAGHLSRLPVDDGVYNEFPDNNAAQLNTDRLSITYMQLLTMAQRLVAGWTIKGLKPGSTILICIPSGGEFCVLLWACVLMRLTMVCMDPSILAANSHRDLQDALRSLNPSIFVAPDRVGAMPVDIAVQELRIPRPLGILLSEDSSGSEWWPLSTFADADPSLVDSRAMMEQARRDDPQRIHSILFTSGTSGKPKGCPLRVAGQTHFLQSWSWLLNEQNPGRALQQAHNSRAIAPTQILQTWSTGGTVLMPSRSFHIEDTIAAIDTFGATFVVLSPAMVHAIADQIQSRSRINLSSVRTVQIGGDAVNRTVLLKCAALFPGARICTHHGMSEGVAAFKWPFFDVPTSQIPFLGETCPTGTVAPGSTVRLWNADKQRAATRSEQGEMHIRSPSIIHHYQGGESETSFYDDAEGRWFITGDTVTMNSNGLIYILGRSKDVITRAGIAIIPGPMESLIQQFLGTQVSSTFYALMGIFVPRLNGASRADMRCWGSRPKFWRSDICGGQQDEWQDREEYQATRRRSFRWSICARWRFDAESA
jgi:acyl-CoA synthetase (AMP-forming)/AMP-acid ligase II